MSVPKAAIATMVANLRPQLPNTSGHVAEPCFIHNLLEARLCGEFENVGFVNKQNVKSSVHFSTLNMSQKETIEVN